MTQAQVPSEEEVFGYVKTLSNWGRWGPDDQLGTINHIGPEQRRQAAALVKDGVSVSCARTITYERAPDSNSVAIHYMTRSGEGFANQPETFPPASQGSGDFIGLAFHGYSITHIDSLCHIFWNGQMYNGQSSALITSSEGATAESIELLQDGVVSRGVLLDAPRHRGVKWLDLGETILPSELDAIEEEQGVRVREGDILLVRTGHYRRRNEEGPRPIDDGWPGLHGACLPWVRERGVAVLGGDTVSDPSPSSYPNLRMPFHQIGIPHMGLWLIDNANLEELAAACAERGRWEFLLTVAPLRIRYGTGSPINPIALF